MREVSTALLAETVKELCISANKILPSSLAARISACRQSERNPLAAGILGDLERNLEAAKELDIPICQDTGMAVCFIEVGQEVAWNMSFVEQLGPEINEKYVSNLDTYTRRQKEMREKNQNNKEV